VSDVTEPTRGVFATTEEKVHQWRLTVVTRAYGAGTYDEEVFLQLEALASSKEDVWLIEKALRAGCPLALAAAIFT